MASANILPATVLAMKFSKCTHLKEGANIISSVRNSSPLIFLSDEHHGPMPKGFTMKITCESESGGHLYSVAGSLTVAELSKFNVKFLNFECKKEENDKDQDMDAGKEDQQELQVHKTYDAFQLLMTGGRRVPDKKTGKLEYSSQRQMNRKTELYNDLVDLFTEKNLTFFRDTIEDEAPYTLSVLTNALWYITNQHEVIRAAARTRVELTCVPDIFSKFQGYNELKRKKLKQQPLTQTGLDSNAQALYALSCRPIMQSSAEWREFQLNVKKLSECLSKYQMYLTNQLSSQAERQSKLEPPRTVGSDVSVEHRPAVPFCLDKYKLFDDVVSKTNDPVFFDESCHLLKPFESSMQRGRYFANMHLSCPIDLFKYSPGGSAITIFFVTKVPSTRPKNIELAHSIKVVQKVIDKLPEYHTRAQKAEFKSKLKNLANIKPAVSEFIYRHLSLDSSAASDRNTQERLKLIAFGHTGLVSDLRSLNSGRPGDSFDTFFEKLEEVVEKVTAADDRRHGLSHLSEWISLEEMISQASSLCPDNTLVPSKALVRLQFSPRNPYTHSAINFTSRIPVQYKIQRRQLRAAHDDQHFCAALFKYMKCKAVELGMDGLMICSDDKAKVPIGDPGLPVSTGVRGKKTIAPTSSTLVACDHDMTRSSITPSVYLFVKTPETPEKSFVSGKVNVVVNDSVLQQSGPFRHAAIICKAVKESTSSPKVILKYSDGGTDQRNTLESVKCATICIFKELDLDMIILARCAPGNSWINPAERIMSILNLGLQNCALERHQHDDDKHFKSCNSMSQIRDLLQKKPELHDSWVSSIEPVQAKIQNRFMRLALKGEPIYCLNPASDDDIGHIQSHLTVLFPTLDLHKLQKHNTKSNVPYQNWLEKHCRQRHYSFQIKKCDDSECCSSTKLPSDLLEWLPDPVLQENDKDHFMIYSEVKGQETTDRDRPSYTDPKKPLKANLKGVTSVKAKASNSDVQVSEISASLFTAQNARSTVECVECRKPRVIYSKGRLTERQQVHIVMLVSEFEYSCGSFLTVPGDTLHKVIFVREQLNCSTPIELSFYSSDLGRADICSFCASPNGEISIQLKAKYKTVLPICTDCTSLGHAPICQRPYGKKK